MDRFDPGPQPAGRPPAPGRLGYVQAFLNSFWDLDAGGAERWATPAAYRRWLADRGFDPVGVGEGHVEQAVALREALRALALANHDDAPAPAALAALDDVAAGLGAGGGLRPRFAAGADRLEPAGEGADAALGLALGIVLASRADGTWRRMKACPHAHCGWAFYDRSRNRSSQWCSMRICGNRTKAETFRSRRRG